jgi:cell division transport system permease protein
MKATLQELKRGVRRNRAGFLMAVAVQGICLLLFTVFAVVTLNVMSLLNSARSRVEIFAFVNDNANADDLNTSMLAITGVAGVRYVSKDSALVELKQDMEESAGIVDALGYNPLPASLRIRLAPGYAQAGKLAEVERKVAVLPGVIDVWSGHELLAKLERIFRTALVIDVGLLLVIALAVIFIVFQSVESLVATRSREIEVMRVVGATSALIRRPFYWEGLVQGTAGGLLAFLLCLVLWQIALTQIPSPVFPVLAVAVFDIVLGGLLGLMGADIAVSRLVK